MKSVTIARLLAAGAVLLCMPSLVADEAADEKAILEAVEAYMAAFNSGDAPAVAAMWSPDAVYTNPTSGEQVAGREAIQKQFTEIFAEEPQAKLVVQTESVQFVSPNVAIEKGTATVERADEDAEQTEYSAVYVRRDGKWLLDRVTETEVPAAEPSPGDHLAELQWMIGTWVDNDDQATVTTQCQWTKNHNFILRLFSVAAGDQIDFSGMQIIGWDAANERIRSWVFDSQGGFGEGIWNRQDNAWHVQASGTAPDGSKASSVNIITYVDDNTFTWQSVDRVVNGELLPNVNEVVVQRQSSEP